MTSFPRALIVEDDPSWQQILSELLTDCGLAVDVASTLSEALLLLKAQSHRVAVVDLSLSPGEYANSDGLQVLDAIRQLDPNCRAILLTGFATVEVAVAALSEYGAFSFLRKETFHRGKFRELVLRALASAPVSTSTATSAGLSRPLPSTLPASSESLRERALIVEDDAGWRNLLAEMLIDCGFQVRACASFGEALAFLRRETYDLAIIDLSLSGSLSRLWESDSPGEELEGYRLLAGIHAAGTPIIIVSGIASADEIQRAYAEQPIFAYLEKQTFERTNFLHLVEEARKSRRDGSRLETLTERERQVLELLAQGLTNKEIAQRLVITTNTVKRHLKSIFEKLGVHTRSAAAAKAVKEKGGG